MRSLCSLSQGQPKSGDDVAIDFDVLTPVIVTISRNEVIAGDVSAATSVLAGLTKTPDTARSMFERVDVSFHGYDQDTRELFEIPEVRDFVYKLDDVFPFWLFFLSKQNLGLQAIALCFLPPFLTEQAKKAVLPQHLERLLNKRWWPAMNQICEFVGFTEDDIEQLSERVMRYFLNGPLPFENE